MADLRSAQLNPALARETWRLAEPIHAIVYFAPERELYNKIGLRGQRMGYFASRSAPLGTPGAKTVIATFYNFSPALVERAIPDAWALADRDAILATRLDVADGVLRRVLGSDVDDPAMAEAAGLAKRAALAAADFPEGRPLFAAHAELEWPETPHLVLWHAQTLLREFRGDGHIAALTVEGLSGIEALISHCASGAYPPDVLRLSRAWSEEEWAAGVEGMRERDLVTADMTLTEAGQRQRQWIEDRTDALSVAGYAALGEEDCKRLGELVRPWSDALSGAGLRSNRE